jgi:hypothetical protein
MPNILYSRNARNYSNTTIQTGTVLVSNFVDPASLADYRVRIEILNVSSGGSLTVSYTIGHSGNADGAETVVFNTVGKHMMGFNRGDVDSTTTISVNAAVAGTVRLFVEVWAMAKGEDYLEWL